MFLFMKTAFVIWRGYYVGGTGKSMNAAEFKAFQESCGEKSPYRE